MIDNHLLARDRLYFSLLEDLEGKPIRSSGAYRTKRTTKHNHNHSTESICDIQPNMGM